MSVEVAHKGDKVESALSQAADVSLHSKSLSAGSVPSKDPDNIRFEQAKQRREFVTAASHGTKVLSETLQGLISQDRVRVEANHPGLIEIAIGDINLSELVGAGKLAKGDYRSRVRLIWSDGETTFDGFKISVG